MSSKVWKDLKAKHKLKLSEVMFKMVCDYFREHGQMPEDTDVEKLAKYSLQRTTQGNGLTGDEKPVRFSM